MAVNWGFLGAGFVASRGLAPAVHASRGANLYAVASRDEKRSATLEPEPTNKFDPTAVKVVVEGVQVGYIPKFDSAAVTQMIGKSGKKDMQVPVRIGFDTDSPQPLIGVRIALTL